MNKKVLITGASRGIGEAIARKLAGEHYDLYLTCHHSEEKLHTLATWLESEYNVSVGAFLCDMSSNREVEKLFRHIPSLDVLINNAGISYFGLLSEMSPESWNQVINTNLSSLFFTSRKAIPLMLQKHRGKIINISSVWGSHGASMEVAYSASKGGVNAFTKALAKELAPSGIQVNAIACGLINTEMNLRLSEAERRSLIEDIPADRMGNTAEVAEMVCSVLSMPSYATGQIFTIDGGWL